MRTKSSLASTHTKLLPAIQSIKDGVEDLIEAQ